jgi:hypothetical protein
MTTQTPTLQTAIPALVPTPEQLDAIAAEKWDAFDRHVDACPAQKRREVCRKCDDLATDAANADQRAKHARTWRESQGAVA